MMSRNCLPNLGEPGGSCFGSPPPPLAVDLAVIGVKESMASNAPAGGGPPNRTTHRLIKISRGSYVRSVFRFLSRGEGRRAEHGFCRRRNALTFIALIIALTAPWSGLFSSQCSGPAFLASQTGSQQEEQKVQADAHPEKIVAGPQNIKERTAIYVFLAWLWVSIGVLVYILRLKIKEVDRLHAIKFFTPDRK